MASSSLEVAVLGLLKEGPMHGYEIKQRLATTLGPLWSISFGSLYPCLKRLESSAFISAQTVEARSRKKTTYEISRTGEEFFFEQLETGAVYDTDRFKLRFAFFRYLSGESRIGLLERRKVYLQERLVEFGANLKATGARIDGYSMSLISHQTEATESDIRWLEQLIVQEKAALSSRESRRK